MAEFPELSEYCYHHRYERPGTLNVGWISALGSFQKWDPPSDFLDRLFDHCRYSNATMQGRHYCEKCYGAAGDLTEGGKLVQRFDQTLVLGRGEVRVFGSNGVIFAAPNLIYHYVETHFYRPPDQFIEAVMEAAFPLGQAYLAKLEELELIWYPVDMRRS